MIAAAAEFAQSWRTLLRRPGYLVLATLTLALGVAATTAVAALLDKALFKPLPYPDAGQLVMLGLGYSEDYRAGAPGHRTALERMQGLESLGLVSAFTRSANIVSEGGAEVASSLLADRGFLETLGLPMAAGRNFSEAEDTPNGPRAVILNHGFWQRRYGGDPAAVGTSLQIEGRAVPIVGVLPADFQWTGDFDLLLPMQVAATSINMATNELLVGRARAGRDSGAMNIEAEALLRAAYESHPGISPQEMSRLREQPMGALPLMMLFTEHARGLWLFFAAAACVLIIAATNLANLMLVRALGRSHDLAVRVALGAPRHRLALPALAEGVLIGVAGALVGLALAWAGLRLFSSLVPADWLRGGVGLTAGSIGFAAATALGVGLLGALLGVWRSDGQALARELAGGGRTGPSRGAGRLARAMVVAQVALAALLLIGAGLFAHSLYKLLSVPMGFESRDVITFTLSPVEEHHPDISTSLAQTQRLLEALQRLPGVEAATVANVPPTRGQFNMGLELPDGRNTSGQYRLIGAQQSEVLRMPLLAGRAIDASDTGGREPVAVVNAEFARAYLDDDALGKVVRLSFDGAPPRRIVGVVGDTRQFGPDQAPPPILYVPFAQEQENVWALIRQFLPLYYMARLQPGTDLGERELRKLVESVAPAQPIADVQTMDAVVAVMTERQRLNLLLVGIFAGLALLLAGVGLYAVTAVAVEARRHEFGVRAALGAAPSRLLRQVLRESALQVALGLAIGLAVAMAMSRVLQRLLFEVGVADPLTLGAVVCVLGVTAGLAGLVPALRASRVPPMQALRQE